jgi:hypothetical protein
LSDNRRASPGGGGRAQSRHRRELLTRRIGALPVQPDQEVLPGQLSRRDPDQQFPSPVPASALLNRTHRCVTLSITPNRSHSSLIAVIPAFGVRPGSSAPIRTCPRFRFPLRIPLTRWVPSPLR